MINAIINVSLDSPTLGGLRAFAEQTQVFGLDPVTSLLDGGHVHVAGKPDVTLSSFGSDLAAVSAFLAFSAELADDTELVHGADLSVDLPVFESSPILCGDHVPPSSATNVLVVVNSTCCHEDLS